VRCINIIVGSRTYLHLLQINAKGSIFHGDGDGDGDGDGALTSVSFTFNFFLQPLIV